MKYRILKYSLKLLLIFTLSFVPRLIFAQGEEDETFGAEGSDVTDTPVDGGVLLLLAGGAAYGLYKRRNEEETN